MNDSRLPNRQCRQRFKLADNASPLELHFQQPARTSPDVMRPTCWVARCSERLCQEIPAAPKKTLFSLDSCRADHLCPFLSIVDDEPTEVSGRACKYLGAQISEAGVELGISQPGTDRTVELVDDVCGRVLRRADSLLADALVAGHELADRRKVRQQLRPGRAGHT